MDYQEKLGQAHEALLNTYFEEVRRVYSALPINQRITILQGLEELLNKSTHKSSNGPHSMARDIREREGLTQNELASLLGINQSSICRYEMGKARRAIKKYADWLKEKGFQM